MDAAIDSHAPNEFGNYFLAGRFRQDGRSIFLTIIRRSACPLDKILITSIDPGV
jgi:hypothetical protein